MLRIRKYDHRATIAAVVGIATAGLAIAQQAAVVGTLDGHTEAVYSVAWSPDGKTLATAGFDSTVRLWDVATRKEIRKYEGHTKLVLAVAVSPNGKQILSGGNDNTAKIWADPGRRTPSVRRQGADQVLRPERRRDQAGDRRR